MAVRSAVRILLRRFTTPSFAFIRSSLHERVKFRLLASLSHYLHRSLARQLTSRCDFDFVSQFRRHEFSISKAQFRRGKQPPLDPREQSLKDRQTSEKKVRGGGLSRFAVATFLVPALHA